jgi:broad specificity phosphatase PhoE
LVRHAAIECGRNGSNLLCGLYDAPVSAAGRAQIDHLRRRLEPEGFAAGYSSPLRRAVETAAAAPASLQGRVRLLQSLAEIHCGAFEGLPLDRLRAEHPDLWRSNESQSDEDFRWPGGESYRRFRRRVLRMIRAIAARHAGGRVLIFTHAGVVNQILGSVAGQSAARWSTFRPANTALTGVLWSGNAGEVIRFDDRSHLSPEYR